MRLGTPIPTGLGACSKRPLTTNSSASIRIEYDSLDRSCRTKYANDFKFLSIPFSFLQLGLNEKGLLYSVELYSFFDNSRATDSQIYHPPANFVNVRKELEALLGKPNNIEVPTRNDSLFIKELGMPLVLDWECNDITLRLRVVYGAHNKLLNILHVSIVDHSFDLPEVERQLN